MICVADSGSTKTDWVIIDPKNKEEQRFDSIGLNPFFVDTAKVTETVRAAIPETLRDCIQQVHFYGAGSSSPERVKIVAQGIRAAMPNATVQVDHDLLASARATCQHDPGIACILGTGSNSCYYDGERIRDNVTALGFILGDEGSGTAIGKELVRAWVYREMPDELATAFASEYNLTKEVVLQNTYNKPLPNRYLASFAPFCSQHRTHPFIANIIRGCLEDFVIRHVLKYEKCKTLPIHCVGSIATAFKEELCALLEEHGLQPGGFVVKPIDALVRFHVDVP